MGVCRVCEMVFANNVVCSLKVKKTTNYEISLTKSFLTSCKLFMFKTAIIVNKLMELLFYICNNLNYYLIVSRMYNSYKFIFNLI